MGKPDTPAAHSRSLVVILLLIGLVLLSVLLALGLGRFSIPLQDVFIILINNISNLAGVGETTSQMETVVMTVRLPRVLAALLVGSALALSGAVYQGAFRNPLVSPDFLGVTSGACVGASLAILAHLNGLGIQVAAFLTGTAAVCCSVGISRLFRQNSPITLVLSGIVVAALFNSLLSLCQYLANVYDELPAIIFWTLGSFATVNIVDVASVAPAIIIVSIILLVVRWRINLLSLDEAEAQTLGMNIKRMRALIILCSTLLTACAVSICGSIGWIGLIIPHLGRLLVGSDNRYLLPVSCLLGGTFLVLADTLARNATASEIPLSIITGIVGAGVFVFIVIKRRLTL